MVFPMATVIPEDSTFLKCFCSIAFDSTSMATGSTSPRYTPFPTDEQTKSAFTISKASTDVALREFPTPVMTSWT